MIIDTDILTEAGFYKCCECGYVVSSINRDSHCSCENNVMAYYPECPACKSNGRLISHCRFCTNSGYDRDYKYINGYIYRQPPRVRTGHGDWTRFREIH